MEYLIGFVCDGSLEEFSLLLEIELMKLILRATLLIIGGLLHDPIYPIFLTIISGCWQNSAI